MNVKEEFLKHVHDRKVLCARIGRRIDILGSIALLKCNYTKNEYENFLLDLDYYYDEGYGWQDLCGTIYYEDGTSDRIWNT